MTIILNGEPRKVAATTLDALLDEVGLSGRVATALNGTFVPKAMRADTTLKDGDQVEVLATMQGG